MAALKVLHEVTACIYKGEEKPVMKWSFLTKVENKDLKSFLQALNAFGVDQRAKELGIQDYKLKLQCKRLTPEPEFPRGRVFAIDSDEQFLTCLPLLQDKHELILKVVEVQCVTVNEAIKFGAKRKHDDVDGNDNQEGINIKKLKSSSKAACVQEKWL
ncbi:uncharacterized protein [Acropora muricata]|uniref:uncharacterized protein n=1 Tax=Acropora muricata TaxID=159855 RepID=UPI0034E56D38